MLRRFALWSAVGLAPLTAIACTNATHPETTSATTLVASSDGGAAADSTSTGVADPGPDAITGAAAPIPAANSDPLVQLDPVVIGRCHLGVIYKVDVSSQHDGMIKVIGTEITPAEARKLSADDVKHIKTRQGEKLYRLLREGDFVKSGQLVAQLDDRLARSDLESKVAKVAAAEAAFKSAEGTREEAKNRWERRQRSVRLGFSTQTDEDVAGAKITYEHMKAEAVKAEKDIDVAKAEANQARTLLEMHEVHTEIPGQIKTIYKKAGENVKAADPVMEIQDTTHLRVEAMVDIEYLTRLHRGMKVQIEQPVLAGPNKTLWGHLADVNSVAVAGDPAHPLVLSASDDGTVGVYDVRADREFASLRHPAGVKVKAVAAGPYGSAEHWCVTGADDGSIRRWNLDNPKEKALEFDTGDSHHQAIHAIAVSPDGKLCATGGDDLDLCLWDVATGKLRFKVPQAHLGTITSLQFTSHSELLSAGKDNLLRRWKVGQKGLHADGDYPNRSGDVTQLGATPDGKKVLFDQGHRLQVLSLPDGVPDGVLQNPTGASNFTTVAIFSPDSRLILTAGGAEGRLQLWRAPTKEGVVPAELRQMTPSDHAGVTCAAFAPDNSFLVTATHDRHVMIWGVPSAKQSKPLTAEVTLIDRIVDASERKARVQAELNNADNQLMPGTTVTMIIPPAKQ